MATRLALKTTPAPCTVCDPMFHGAACEAEVELTMALRDAGCGVWRARACRWPR
jgi:hypothetical protein